MLPEQFFKLLINDMFVHLFSIVFLFSCFWIIQQGAESLPSLNLVAECEFLFLAFAGLVSPSSLSATVDKQDYYSTFHKTPKQKKFTKKQREDFTRESTHQAVAEWAASPEVTSWIIKNADRIQLLPGDYSSEEMVESKSDSTGETVSGRGKPFSLFNRR